MTHNKQIEPPELLTFCYRNNIIMRPNEVPERIPTPSFRRVNNRTQQPNRPSKVKKAGRKEQKNILRESIDDESIHARHRPLENAERRERRREEELMKYEEYIVKLRRDYPELFK